MVKETGAIAFFLAFMGYAGFMATFILWFCLTVAMDLNKSFTYFCLGFSGVCLLVGWISQRCYIRSCHKEFNDIIHTQIEEWQKGEKADG